MTTILEANCFNTFINSAGVSTDFAHENRMVMSLMKMTFFWWFLEQARPDDCETSICGRNRRRKMVSSHHSVTIKDTASFMVLMYFCDLYRLYFCFYLGERVRIKETSTIPSLEFSNGPGKRGLCCKEKGIFARMSR
jgi:hypothetical protein